MRKSIIIVIFFTFFLNAKNYQTLWSKVQKFEENNRTKSALNIVNKIYKRAKQDRNETQLIKSIIYKEKYSYILEKNISKDIINEINSTTNITTKLILKSILAQIYSRLDREDLNPIVSKLYMDSLQEEAKAISIDRYSTILLKGNNRDIEPTLYDFLAFRALEYFNKRVSYDEFYIKSKEGFSCIDKFLKFNFKSNNSILIYKKLISFHKDDKDRRALNYVNLERIKFIYNHFIDVDRDKYYIDILNSLDLKGVDEARLYLAEYYFNKKDYKKALLYIEKGIKSRDIYLLSKFKKLKNSIEESYLSLNIESINLPNRNILAKISYKNIDKIYIKVVKLRDKIIDNKEKIKKYIKSVKSINEFNLTLPKVDDYKKHSSEISLGSYPLGEYLFIISNSRDFNRTLVYSKTTLSNLAYFHRNSKILVLNRDSGEPIEDVNVSFYTHSYSTRLKEEKIRLIKTLKSDSSGLVDVPKNIKNYSIRLQYGDDILDRDSRFYYSKESKRKDISKNRVYFFTDKGVYLPSEDIYFKAIVVKSFNNREPKVIKNRKIEIALYSGDKKIDKRVLKTDEFGSLYGSFTTPKGVKDLYLSSNLGGNRKINIGEYKRANFRAIFEKIKSYRVGDKVTIKGSIEALNGKYKLDRLKIKYRVHRVVNYPWTKKRSSQKERLIAIGATKTNKSGRFKIEFNSKVEESFKKEDKALFSYRVDIDITDQTGTTQSYVKVINIGFIDIYADILIDNELDKNRANRIKIKTKDLYGNSIEAKGKISIERLKPKDRIYRKRYWSRVDRPIYSRDSFKKLFKDYEYKNNTDKKLIKTIKFDTSKSKEILLEGLKEGEYIFRLNIEDRYGNKATKSKRVIIYDVNQKLPPKTMALWTKLDRKEYSIGSTAILNIKSSILNAPIFFTLYRGDELVKSKWIKVEDLTKELIPILKEDRGDVFYSIIMVHNNRNYSQNGVIKVPWESRLKVNYISFKDKIKLDSKEEWRLKLDKQDKAQMVATLYDISSDKYIKNDFNIDNLYPKHKIPYYQKWVAKDFYYIRDIDIYKRGDRYINRVLYRLNWFGFYIENREDKSSKKERNQIVRDRFKKTIFFKPILETNRDNNLVIDFKTPKTISKWRFLAFIHTKDLKVATIKREIITKKDLMVINHLPNFFREGDSVVISPTIVNRSGDDLNGSCTINILDKNLTKTFIVKREANITLNFKIEIPNRDKYQSLKIKTTVKTDNLSDKKEIEVPILSKRVLLNSVLPIYIEPKESKSFIIKPKGKLTIETTTNPAWYAILSMPYIINYPENSTEELFNKYFIYSIALKLLKSSPQIEDILNELKKKKQYKSIGSIFNIKKLQNSRKKIFNRLKKRYKNGWAWFNGGEANLDTTLYIVDGFRRVKEFGINIEDRDILKESISLLDNKLLEQYRGLKKSDRLKEDNLNSQIIEYLYIRSFYNFPLLSREAYNYYLNQTKEYWRDKSIYQQATIGLILNRKLAKNETTKIINSLKKRLISNNNGVYFNYKDIYNKTNIEIHTRVMSLFSQDKKNKKILEKMKIWLLKNRVDNHWITSNSSTSAIETILLDNSWISDRNRLVDIELNGNRYKNIIKRAKESAIKGVGYLKVKLNSDNNISTIKIVNSNSNPIWGDISSYYYGSSKDTIKLPIHIDKNISINRKKLLIGDKIDITLKVKVDKDMKFILLEDEIPSTFNIIGEVEEYRDNKNIGYYIKLKNSSLKLFFDNLPKGKYSFKYSLYTTTKGRFYLGTTSIEEFYNPKFKNYIRGKMIRVK